MKKHQFPFKKRWGVRDMHCVENLIENANRILATAVEAEQSGLGSNDWTIYVTPEGGYQFIAGSETSLDSLAWSRGAQAAWQVTRANGAVRVDGRSMQRRCRIESESPRRVAQLLLGATHYYDVASAASCA
jgi:hypothetical protein